MSIPFKYSTDGGATWESANEQGATVGLSNGVLIAFGSSELASNTATAAPGDLSPLPDGDEYSATRMLTNGELAPRYTAASMQAYGRACIASNAGAAAK